MTASPSDPKSASGDSLPQAGEPSAAMLTFEDKLQIFWKRHSTLVIACCVVVVLAIAGAGLWEYFAQQKELEVQKEYAAASTAEAAKAFAAKHPDHVLAGAVYLRLGDDAFATDKTADALANYEKAAAIFKDGPLAARTKLGIAMTKILGGKAGEGASELKQLAEDSTQFKAVRAEAAYQLASLASDSGVASDVQKYSDLLMQIDPSSPWTQRALALRAMLPPPAAPKPEAASVTPPAIQFTPAAK